MTDRSAVRTGETEIRPLYPALRAVAMRAPDAPAVVGFDGTALAYGQLLETTDAVAEALSGSVRSARVVGLALDDPLTFVAAYFAAAKLGLVIVLLDSRAAPEETARLAAKFDLDVLVRDGAAGSGSIAVEAIGTAGRGAAMSHEYLPADFVVHCTSGSTGEPKGIVMSQPAVMERVRSWSHHGELRPSDVVLCALPLWHGHGIDVLTLPSLLSGAKVVFARGAHLTARGLARMIDAHAVTIVSGLPVMYHMLVEADGVDRSMLGSLRLALTGSAPISADTQVKFREQFGLPLRQGYGLGEIGIITYDAAYAGPGTIGLPLSGIDWRLEPVEMPDGESQVFELLVRGPSLARGYYRDPAAEATMFVDGWLRTHDLVAVRPDGWFIRGRKSTFINVTGNKVAPTEVEMALRKCDGVIDCAVVGVPDGECGERVAALIVSGAAGDPETVRRQVGAHLLPHQFPQTYTFAATVPRTPVGKIDYEAVRRIIHSDGAISE
ncbi:class I adenylate-forming enzyme family protein [Streptomyces sp. ME19-01-6]|uniref:class I adenylate-forming enzyme family protein n=1 Tax=Streptomyces sp. ME19-01-6 TaxID=3028686 RepID=UPI0029A9A9D4|nr:class I adenylate-forming enzyme family protein [Streptomyces sp. ME19-01-6]MDX3228672.1 class I adenylate-forming enzyme family protein [Streptomyces sp. ME19-01-6]